MTKNYGRDDLMAVTAEVPVYNESPNPLHQLPRLPQIIFIRQPAMIPLERREDEINHVAQLPPLAVRLPAD